MKKRINSMSMAAVIIISLFFPIWSFGQEIPEPGTIIDKSNYKRYEHFFPPEFLGAFEDGFSGLVPPVTVKVTESRPCHQPKRFQTLSAKNRGKYGVDEAGFITGGYTLEGLPFPGVTPDDQNFAVKFMWNYIFRYMPDSNHTTIDGYMKRKGEPLRISKAKMPVLYFINRIYENPMPTYQTPGNLMYAQLLMYKDPPSMKNSMMLMYRYRDLTRSDEIYIYLPALRRVLRGEAGQRSTPMMGSMASPDDMAGFDGRVPEFTYKFVGEKKVLGVVDSKLTRAAVAKQRPTEVPFFVDDHEIRDVYVIDIFPKNPKYPQSKKRIYIDKETFGIYYSLAWDRAGELWKIWNLNYVKLKFSDGDTNSTSHGPNAWDVQFGLAEQNIFDQKPNAGEFTYQDFTPSILPKKAR